MKEDKKDLNENFLSRWSKKKSKQKSENEISKIESTDFNSSQGDEVSKSSTSEVSENDKLNDDELLKKYNLPNPEKIKKEKSLDVFFKDGVPDRLRQIALRRVWRLNPIISFADAEINDYHEDFTDAATVIEGMETAYKVGKGYLSDLIDDKDEKNDVESITPIVNSYFGRYNLSSNNAKILHNINEEDQLRADMYSFLANLLRAEPDENLVNQLTMLDSDDSPIGKSIKTLSKLATSLDLPTIRDEYVRIFVGVGRGEILPFASYYLTGFLKDKPLAKLRQDMQKIGIKLEENVKEPEDHIASIFDMMSGLILGKFEKKYSITEQKDFFNKHLAPWVDLLMRDIESSKIAVFYSPIGTIGKEFMEIERASFSMNVSG